jgi:hypothetical protein
LKKNKYKIVKDSSSFHCGWCPPSKKPCWNCPNPTTKECMMTLKEATWVVRTMLRKRKLKKIGNDYLFIFNQSILFNSIIKFIYKNKLNKKQWIKKYERTQSNKKKNKWHKKAGKN